MRIVRWLWIGLLWACGDDAADRVIDVQGPRGRVSVEGPWAVDVITRQGPARLFVGLDDATPTEVPVVQVADGWVRGELPAAPLLSRVRYYATVDADRAPVAGAFAFELVTPPAPPEPPPDPTPCALRWRQPAAGVVLQRDDDNGPQAGVQINVIIDGVVPDHSAGVLSVGDRRYAARALGGLLVFGGVDVPSGDTAVRVEATTPGGAACALDGAFSAR